MAEQISAWQCAHNVRSHRNMYAKSLDIPTGLTEELILRYLHNSIKWHTLGDLERMLELRRKEQAEQKKSGREKRTLIEPEVNAEPVKRMRL